MARSVNTALLALWRERFTSSENAGRTAKELAALFDVHVATIQYWRSKLAALDKLEQTSSSSQSAFVPVLVQPAMTGQQVVVVRLPGDVTISLPCDAISALITVIDQLKPARRA
jgi:hypothetical protein